MSGHEPLSYKNWKLQNTSELPRFINEYPIYTDADIRYENLDELGPYSILNAIIYSTEIHKVRTPLILRIKVYLDNNDTMPDMSKTQDYTYHGGWYQDEIAALMSLNFGVRFHAGACSRVFGGYNPDPLGSPEYDDSFIPPTLNINRKRLILPNALQLKNIDNCELIKGYPELTSSQATSLIKATRQYQNALWIAESDPSTAWLFMISALETGANSWVQENYSNYERLLSAKPELAELLEKEGSTELVEQVAEMIAPLLGATNKFLKFCLEFKPEEPEIRPEGCKLNWNKTNFKNALNKIYGHRSKALHGGTPIPAPMCKRPSLDRYGIPHESISGLASSTLGSNWLAEDTPMYLNTFEYITRGVLQNWWKRMIQDNKNS